MWPVFRNKVFEEEKLSNERRIVIVLGRIRRSDVVWIVLEKKKKIFIGYFRVHILSNIQKFFNWPKNLVGVIKWKFVFLCTWLNFMHLKYEAILSIYQFLTMMKSSNHKSAVGSCKVSYFQCMRFPFLFFMYLFYIYVNK